MRGRRGHSTFCRRFVKERERCDSLGVRVLDTHPVWIVGRRGNKGQGDESLEADFRGVEVPETGALAGGGPWRVVRKDNTEDGVHGGRGVGERKDVA
jgi:hypothetical protein